MSKRELADLLSKLAIDLRQTKDKPVAGKHVGDKYEWTAAWRGEFSP